MSSHIVITTPRGQVAVGPNGRAELVWSTTFRPKWQKRYTDAQKFVDGEVLAKCEPYTPMLTSMLIKSGTLGTIIGSGLVSWIAPYSKAQYYLLHRRISQTGPNRGSFWFQRMKEVWGNRIIEGARRIAGGGK